MTTALLILVLGVCFVAVLILVAYVWIKDPFKTALGSCLSSLALLVGSLSVPEVKGTADFAFDIGIASFKSNGVAVTIGTPSFLWAVAFVSIVILIALFAVLLFLRERHRRPIPPEEFLKGEGYL